MRFPGCFLLALLVGLACFPGCSSQNDASAPADSATATTAGDAGSTGATDAAEPVADDVRKVPSTTLPATQGISPPVDGGRLQVPLLAKWTIPPRTSEWLFRLQRDKKTAYPQILITVDESFVPEVEKLNKTNIAAFIPKWQQHLEKSHDAKAFGEKAAAVRIGKRYGAENLLHSSTGKMSLDQLQVSMVGAGRVYTFELRALRGTLEDYRMDFYAVVAGAKMEEPAAVPGGLEPLGAEPAEEAATPATEEPSPAAQ